MTSHTRFGNPRAEKAPNYITYPDACAWLGALWFSKTIQDKDMQRKLKERFEPLFTTEKHLMPRMNHVDHNVVGAVPLEIYMQKLGDKKYYDLGMKYADSQWEVPADAKPEQKAYADQGYSWQTRVWIDDMFMITTIQSQAYLATGNRKYIDRAAAEMVMYLEKYNVLTVYSITRLQLLSSGLGEMVGWLLVCHAYFLSYRKIIPIVL